MNASKFLKVEGELLNSEMETEKIFLVTKIF